MEKVETDCLMSLMERDKDMMAEQGLIHPETALWKRFRELA